MAINKAEKIKADIVIGTDPDSDRLGIAVLSYENKWEILNGNQMMMIMIRKIRKIRKRTRKSASHQSARPRADLHKF